MKLNCWEHKNCGRAPLGSRAGEMGVCPAATEAKLDGVHGGLNAGRACWAVSGTFCEGRVQGSFAQKFTVCQACDFFRAVKSEEKDDYQMSIMLLNRMRAFE